MTQTIEVECYRVYGWSRGRWTLRSTHPTYSEAADAAEFLFHRDRTHTRVSLGTRRVAAMTEAPAPTAAQRHREAQADAMVLRRQTHAYFKSGCNGTELIAENPL